jgi:hypothetical protein
LYIIHTEATPLTEWNRVSQKLIAAQMASKFPAFYATRRFSAMCKGARKRTVSSTRWVQPKFSNLDPFQYYPKWKVGSGDDASNFTGQVPFRIPARLQTILSSSVPSDVLSINNLK